MATPNTNPAVAFVTVDDMLRRHDRDRSMGAVMAQMIERAVASAHRRDELLDQGATEAEAEAVVGWSEDAEPDPASLEQLDRELAALEVADALQSLGLELGDRDGSWSAPDVPGGQVRLRISNGGRLAERIRQLPQDDLDPSVATAVDTVATHVAADVARIAHAEVDPPMREAIVYAGGIAQAMAAVGLGDRAAAKTLHAQGNHWRRGDLTEYLRAERLGLLEPAGSDRWGPSRWQRDSTAGSLQQRWDDVARLIDDCRANPAARQFGAEMEARAREHLSEARRDWAEQRRQVEAYGAGFDAVFTRVAARIGRPTPGMSLN